MKCNLISVLMISMCASSSFAGFTVTATKAATVDGLDRWDIVAVNTGGGTGTQIKGMEYFYQGAPAAFEVNDLQDVIGGDPDGEPDTVNLLSNLRTRVRVSATAANNVFVGVSPPIDFVQPNPYLPGVTAFQGAIANTGTTQASGAGFQIARIFIPQNASGRFSGNLGGDVGTKVPFSVQLLQFVDPGFPVIQPVPPVNVVFGAIVSNGAPFSANVTVTDSDASAVLSLSTGTLPAGVGNVTITGPGPSPRVFTVSGVADYSLNGTDVVIPIVARSSMSPITANGAITLHVTPEPMLGSAIGASSLWLGGRRRK